MAKIRVYDLAKELGVDNKAILAELENAGITEKTPSSGLDDDQVKLLKGRIKGTAVKEKPRRAALEEIRIGVKPAEAKTGVTIGARPAAKPGEGPDMPMAAKKVARKAAEPEKPVRSAFVLEAIAKAEAEALAHPAPPVEPMPAEPTPVVEATAPEAVTEATVSGKAPEATAEVSAEALAAPAAPAEQAQAAPAAPAPAEEPTQAAPEKPAAPEHAGEGPAGEAVKPSPSAAPPAPESMPQAPVSPVAPVQPRMPEPPRTDQRPPFDRRPQAPGAPGQPQRPSAPQGEHRPPQRPMQPGQPHRPMQPGQPQHPRPGQPAPAADANKFKKPHPKGPKPARPELEVLDGVDRAPVIPAKLKSRLQPVVKKAKTGPAEAEAHPPKTEGAGRRWQDFKGGKKKGGKGGRQQYGMEKVDEQAGTLARKRAIKVTEGLTVKDFADKIGQKVNEVLKKLFEMGIMATINQTIDPDAAVLIAESYGLKIEVTPITDDEAFVEEETDRDEDLKHRPPVVTIMGHVDHGKTSLLDAIRKTNVTGGEAGGITQHIGAYKVRLKDKDIVFLDTPGHEAFTAMRARGAQVTDIVVLVVAADDGVRPQTIEAINHAKAAKVPIIVAVNKIDKPEADQDKVKRELSDHGLVSEEWGGEVIFAAVSAKKQIGLENLLEMILLQAEVMELKANPNKPGRGSIIEAKLDKGRGPVATVLVSTGTIRPGDAFVSGQHYGRIRMLLNDKGKKEKEAGPATPVEVIGLSGVPAAGDSFVVMEDEKRARQVAQSRMQKLREVELASRKRVTLDDLFSQIQQGEVKELNIIIKADVQGSAEAVAESLLKLSTDAVKLKVIHASVGAITESDVMLASASNAIIIGFNIRPDQKAASLGESEGVDIRLYNIIYNAIDEVRAAMEGLLEPTFKEKVTGRAEVRQTFSVPKIGVIAGCYILDGSIARGCAGVRVLRDNVVIFTGKLGSLKRFKEDVKEVLTGYECGMGVENFNDLKVGDVIEAYDIEKTAGKL
ncbi:MAG: translation initiation factor IF-2 [Nitrospirae bacterium]|nr:translation initiation factor IF-2 [Nitrospirota bacterium]